MPASQTNQLKNGFAGLLFTLIFSGLLVSGFILIRAIGGYAEAMAHVAKEIDFLGGCQEAMDFAASNLVFANHADLKQDIAYVSGYVSGSGIEFVISLSRDTITIRSIKNAKNRALIAKYVIINTNKAKVYNGAFEL